MILNSPRPRFKLYGGFNNYRLALRELLFLRANDDIGAIEELEGRVASQTGTRHAIAMPQARVGIYTTIRALVKPGQSVIMSPYTIYDVVNMVIAAGGRPVFADVDGPTCNISPEGVARLINSDTGAVLVTHLHGIACDIESIGLLCAERNIPVIEDVAQAYGAQHPNGRSLGSIGTAGVFSFGIAKNVNSFYGGMVVTSNDALADDLRQAVARFVPGDLQRLGSQIIFCFAGELLSSWPIFQTFTFWLFRYGYLNDIEALNKHWRGENRAELRPQIPEAYLQKLTPLQARIILAQLDGVKENNRIRIEHARAYNEGLKDIPGCIVPPFTDDGSQIYLSYPLQIENRHQLLRYLMINKRDLTVQHIKNYASDPVFKTYHCDCPVAERIADRVLLLPTYPSYGMAEVHKNIEFIRGFFSK